MSEPIRDMLPLGLLHERLHPLVHAVSECITHRQASMATPSVVEPECLFYTHRWAPFSAHRRFPRAAREWALAVLMCAHRLSAIDDAITAERLQRAGLATGTHTDGEAHGSLQRDVLPRLPVEMWFKILSEVTMARFVVPERVQ